MHSFRGGVHPLSSSHHGKTLTSGKAVVELKAPQVMYIPMQQHIGPSCDPIVEAGQAVKVGQMIGRARGFVCAPIHSSVSGVVRSVAPYLHVSGQQVMTVTIENDGRDEPDEGMRPRENVDALTPEALIEIIRDAGIVGMGGAQFPTHVKLSPPKDKPVDVVILNGAECEPFLSADHRLMVERAWDVVRGLLLAQKAAGATRVLAGIEVNKPDAIEAIKKASGGKMDVVPLAVKYPQGSEKQLIQALSSRQVPSGGLPSDVGCVVINAGTAAAIADAVYMGKPLYERIVTVSGLLVKNPQNLLARIGTPVTDLIDACGGFTAQPERVLSGGPMMGTALYSLEVSVIKGTSGIVALAPSRVGREDACIRCGRCVGVCPMGLVPMEIARRSGISDFKGAEAMNAMDCMECGCCTFICPARRELLSRIRVAKRAIQAVRKKP